MIICRTPFRISFVGGGTDLSSFYKLYPGRTLNTTINKYIYIIIKKRYDDLIVLNYYKKEIVDHIDKIEHDYIREALKLAKIYKGVEITTISDISSKGSGLGSSSSLTVGLLNAMFSYKGEQKDLSFLAKKACEIEINILNNPIGKQDQYAATFGGLNLYTFNSDESVNIRPINMKKEDISYLSSNLYLVNTGISRKASSVLKEQKKNTKINIEYLKIISQMPYEAKRILEERKFNEFGEYLDKAWQYKKQLSTSITNPQINSLYTRGINSGAIGGKLLGAGGGGFILFYVPLKNKSEFINEILKTHKILPFKFDFYGTKIIFNS